MATGHGNALAALALSVLGRGVLVVLTVLLSVSGCRHAAVTSCRNSCPPSTAYDPMYGPNPLAEFLHWPQDAPRVEALYAP
ncbi:MAG: hypothetical protein EXS05_00180 [Planctomycetaceae bacterium]|nr:hypothetical protein [Planctomycetaceae bacterium]